MTWTRFRYLVTGLECFALGASLRALWERL